ncbi:hypothetical protein [Actinoplanes sp. NPDC049316]|uniref:hypothetical protein n=1 Tax=Actinoplanes sp. NPDC049316 TaxID=3154727 RepID=UPI00342A7342
MSAYGQGDPQRSHSAKRAGKWLGLGLIPMLIVFLFLFSSSRMSNDTADPTTPSVGIPRTDDFTNYAKRCLRATESWDQAQLIFDPDIEMKQERSATVQAKLTLDRSLTPDAVMPSENARSIQVRVSCEAEATIVANEEDFEVSPSGWTSRSVFEGQDADWQWIVTPKRVGTYAASINVRPVILVDGHEARLADVADSELIEQRPIVVPARLTIHVKHRSFAEAAKDWLTSTKGVIVSLTSLIAALSALYLTVRFFGRSSSLSPSGTKKKGPADRAG